MWMLIAGPLAIAAPVFVGVELGGEPIAHDGGVAIPLYSMVGPFTVNHQVRLAFVHRGASVEVRCEPDDRRCRALDGPWPGRRFPMPTEAASALTSSRYAVRFQKGTASHPSVGLGEVVAAQSLLVPLVRSDLAGDTGWSRGLELSVELSGPARWSAEASTAFTDLPGSRTLTVAPEQADRWRCRAAGWSPLVDTLVQEPRAGMAWLVEAEARCDATPSVRGSFCAALPDGDLAEVTAWCAATPAWSPDEGPVLLHHTEVEVKRRAQPVYPPEAKALGLGEVRCKARIYVDETGRPTKVMVEDCPVEFHRSTQESLMRWQWYPELIDGAAVPFQTVIVVRYVGS